MVICLTNTSANGFYQLKTYVIIKGLLFSLVAMNIYWEQSLRATLNLNQKALKPFDCIERASTD